MKIAIKLYLIITPLLCSTLYGAERVEPFDDQKYYTQIFAEFLAKTNNMDPESMKQYRKELTEQATNLYNITN